MKEEDESQTTTTVKKQGSSEVATTTGGLFSRSRYKFWALAAILLLAFWSMFTGSVTLKWSSGNLNNLLSDDFDSPIHNDLDILEVEEREKLVRKMWDVYTHSTTIRLPRFWQEAFEAAYEYLTSEVTAVRNAAVSEIAKMSLLSLDIEPPPVQPTNTRERSRTKKQAGESKKASVAAASTS